MVNFKKKYGPWAVITGASNGIGKSMAESCAKQNINIVLSARRYDVLNDLSKTIEAKFGVKCLVVAADLSTEEGCVRLQEVTNQLDIGLFIASAGFGSIGPFIASNAHIEANMVDLNCRAVALLTHHYANRFAAKKRGGIVLMSSIVGFQGVPNSANYAATKAYVQSLAEGLFVELRPHNVDVIASAPGPVNSGFADRANMKMSRSQKPVEVADATLRALGRRSTVRPGALAKFLGYSLSTAPRFLRTIIMNKIMLGMIRHPNNQVKNGEKLQ